MKLYKLDIKQLIAVGKNKISIIAVLFVFLLLPSLFIFLINEQYKKIMRTPDSYYKQTGIVEDLGMTTKTYRGSSARISKTPTFFVKMKACDTIFSYSQSIFNRNYEAITKRVNRGDSILIYHEGFNKRQNTVDIVQLEKRDTVIISKTLFNNKETILLVWFYLLLVVSLFPAYMFVKYGHWRSKQ